jgi:hypothetical protein
LLGIHEARGRRYVIVRGEPGSDREHVVVRDSDPRLGDVSLFELEPEQWVGRRLEVADMITSEISAVELESNPLQLVRPADLRNARLVVVPAGLQEHPRMKPALSRGTLPDAAVAANRARPASRAPQQPAGGQGPSGRAVTIQDYPLRHVGYAEQAAAMLGSIANREQIFLDLVADPGLRTRLRKALDECDKLLKHIQKWDLR